MNATQQRPWYRQFWVWFVIAIPAVSIISSLNYVYLAVIHRDDVVSGDWYQDGKAINENFARVDTARGLQMHASIILDDLSGEVIVSMQATDKVKWPATLTFSLNHATQQIRDQVLKLNAIAPGEYRGQMKKIPIGRFTLDISTTDWHMSKDVTLPARGNIDLSVR